MRIILFIFTSFFFQKSISVSALNNRPAITLHQKFLGCNQVCWHNEIETVIEDLQNFDRSISIQRNEIAASMNLTLNTIFPSSLLQIENLREDTEGMINTMRDLAFPSESITCRLALINGVRCPKWHEDYVKIRLIKTYYGAGTEWVNPDDWIVRAINHFRANMDLDLDVDSSKVMRASVNDILILNGREREDLSIIPVLHRSPPVRESERRLLLTVTIS